MNESIRPILSGYKALVVGIANDQSIAYGCAKAFRATGAEVAVTWLNDKARRHVEPLAKELEAPIAGPLDVSVPGQLEAMAMVGLGTPEGSAERRINRDLASEAAAVRRQADLERRFEVGGLPEAIVRAVIHVRLPEGSVDERGFAALQALRRAQPANRRLTFGEVKALFRDQYLLLRLDEERAVRAIPKLLPDSDPHRHAAWVAVRDVIAARGELGEEGRRRFDRLQQLFGVTGQP